MTPRSDDPVRTVYREVFDDQASWTDALFWFLMGALSVGAIWWSTLG